MSRFHSYISSATKILASYDGSKPMFYHLKHFFSADKKFGSRDRKLIAALCYSYFRIGHALRNMPVEEKLLAGLFLSENKKNDLLEVLCPAWNQHVTLPAIQKLSLLNLTPADIFPFSHKLGNAPDPDQFALSFLHQPDLYLRIRPGKHRQVIDKLNQAALPFESMTDDCLRFSNSTSLDTILKINKEVVIQDYNSQQVLDFLKDQPDFFSKSDQIHAWDCCAASGGKSILLYDILQKKVKLTVSDIRENILVNLVRRFQEAGINIDRKFIADLAIKSPLLSDSSFNIILCDVPCTGSGTWARTPEQLYYFNEDSIHLYAEKQRQIVSNTIPHLKAGGLLFYITCSVFKMENEDVVTYIEDKFRLKLLKMKYLEGYGIKADTMFVAVFSTVKA